MKEGDIVFAPLDGSYWPGQIMKLENADAVVKLFKRKTKYSFSVSSLNPFK